MSNKPWIESYPAGVPKSIDADKYGSLAELFVESRSKYSDLPAYENMGKIISFEELGELSDRFASYFQNDLGLKPGDKIAIQLPNVIQNPVVMYAALKAGLVVVNTNPLYTPSEMRHQFKDSGAKAIVILANFAANLEEIIKDTSIDHVIITELGDMLGGVKGALVSFVVKKIKKMVPAYSLPEAIPFKKILKEARSESFTAPKIDANDLAFLQYTGGTTGVSKGAMLTHRNLIGNLQQIECWLKQANPVEGKEIFIAALPLYHIFALNAHALLPAKVGAKNVLITNPRDMKGFVKELKKHPYTLITGVNTLFNGLLNTPGFAELDHSTIKVALAGGMALQRAVFDKWEKVTGKRIAEAYGLTETSPGLCINPLSEGNRVGTIGLPLPDTDVKLLDDEGNEVAEGERGELCCKGPQVFTGYWQREEESESSFINGYFKTGDIATMDPDGYFRIVDRKKEMILVSGFNVYPNEVEDAIATHPKVLEVGAIGVPDSKSTEAVKVYIVKKDQSLTEQEIIDHCKDNLTGYKRPKHVAFSEELPKSNVGKILRRLIKEEDARVCSYD
ncbi:MAG: long-chain-fatty-acid--CoA ligase [Flammeovirgaceae bacterium]|nr:long-chain-fatty-acid--CoA ligase [Flammeovirgaceae bacterium]MBE63479.1 long-chain-fatty-acid--CoA ligase [Flammeovirgaceae bacterium]MBR06485.1 long-chain-fatty-acid--CoA ligase [Rickettsiales bacterium]|tara:strand:- start:788 stop:2476 length:1689 start_codon:yes stop_codon:yes gene_type:complete